MIDRIRTKLKRQAERIARVPIGPRPAYRFVFVVTYGRTGSTLLQKLIDAIPGHYIAGENHGALHGLYQSWANANVLKEKYGWGHQASDHPWHGALAADPEQYGKALAAAFVDHVLKPPRGATTIGFKEIRYLGLPDLPGYLAFIAAHFAPATFVFNTRALGEVGQSAWWKTADKDKLAADVAAFERDADSFVAAHPASAIKLDYARWTQDPEALRPLFVLLNAPFDAAQVTKTLAVRLEHMR